MTKKYYDVHISRTYSSYVVIEADSAERAEEYAWAQLVAKKIDPTQWDCSDMVESGEDLLLTNEDIAE